MVSLTGGAAPGVFFEIPPNMVFLRFPEDFAKSFSFASLSESSSLSSAESQEIRDLYRNRTMKGLGCNDIGTCGYFFRRLFRFFFGSLACRWFSNRIPVVLLLLRHQRIVLIWTLLTTQFFFLRYGSTPLLWCFAIIVRSVVFLVHLGIIISLLILHFGATNSINPFERSFKPSNLES
jgi:hypothetical protein